MAMLASLLVVKKFTLKGCSHGELTVFEAPEAGNRVMLIDITAADANAAISAAWTRVGGKNASRTASNVAPASARSGWDERVSQNILPARRQTESMRPGLGSSVNSWAAPLPIQL